MSIIRHIADLIYMILKYIADLILFAKNYPIIITNNMQTQSIVKLNSLKLCSDLNDTNNSLSNSESSNDSRNESREIERKLNKEIKLKDAKIDDSMIDNDEIKNVRNYNLRRIYSIKIDHVGPRVGDIKSNIESGYLWFNTVENSINVYDGKRFIAISAKQKSVIEQYRKCL